MIYSIHSIREGRSTKVRAASSHSTALDIAAELAAEEAEDQQPVWCPADSWHDEPGLEPVGGFDLGHGAVIVYWENDNG